MRLVEAAQKAGTPLRAGHHRRYSPLIQKAKTIIDSGRLGKIVAVHGAFWVMKPEDYFDAAWRREKGAGPILTNLIHDVDLFRYLCREVIAVQVMESNARRCNSVEDTAAILLRFVNGAIGSMDISDSIVAPWSWELTTGENPAYPQQDQFCYLVGGTHGSLAVPQLEIWENPDKRSWLEPLTRDSAAYVLKIRSKSRSVTFAKSS